MYKLTKCVLNWPRDNTGACTWLDLYICEKIQTIRLSAIIHTFAQMLYSVDLPTSGSVSLLEILGETKQINDKKCL